MVRPKPKPNLKELYNNNLLQQVPVPKKFVWEELKNERIAIWFAYWI